MCFLLAYYRKYNLQLFVLTECPKLPLSIIHGYVNGTSSVQGSEYSFSCNQCYSLFGERGLRCTAEGKWNASYPSCLKDMSSHFISTNSLRVELFKSCFSVLHNGFKTTRLGMKLNISFLYLALEFLAEK